MARIRGCIGAHATAPGWIGGRAAGWVAERVMRAADSIGVVGPSVNAGSMGE